ncbi:WD repeat-containing protein 3 [Eumeta japonica]|uniref:WD repeat-containing protein 3 n=1 Tax=Eumeta variegata TaxID=151549 RepID=A0A4C1VN45_EUMVA|nr:WD repeat-containing protein 3 [Eumeta japonica]
MGLTKQYLRYAASGTFSVIASAECNNAHISLNGISGRYFAVGACEHVIIWDMRLGEKAQVLPGENVVVSQLTASPTGNHIAVGYVDGNINVFELKNNEIVCVFSGHKSGVTSLQYDEQGHRLVSGSKVWSAVLLKEERYLVTGGADQDLRVWKLKWIDEEKEEDKLTKQLEIVRLEETDVDETSVLQCHQVGTLMRGGRGRVVQLAADPGQSVLACFGTDSLLEMFTFCSDEEAKQRMAKRIKKQKKKIQKRIENGETGIESTEVPELLTLSDEVKRMPSVKLGAKLKSVSLLLGATGELRIAITLSNNTVEMHSLMIADNSEVKCLKQISQPGHNKDPRCVALSSDNLAILSASADAIKLWNRPSQVCIRTIPVPSGRPLCLCFAPGDRHALVGCADGQVLVLDVAAGVTIENVAAHTAECNTIGLTPDMRGCYSGGGDKTVKLWNFELIPDPTGESKAKVLSLLHTRTLELEESVLAVKISPNNKFIAVALLDSTVKIFFLDTFKFYLSLYGHKLPVLCLDISYDSNLIATGSTDRNVKIWGMDFGDCHKSIFAHNDSVTALQFVPNTHYFFTGSKDGKVKQWDGDTYDNIITLNGHAGECWSVSVGAGGAHVVSCGGDHALRLYSRTEEPLVLGDTDDAEEGLATGEKAPVPGFPNLNMPSMKTIGAEKSADSILECLQACAEYEEKKNEGRGKVTQLPLLMTAYNCTEPSEFLLDTFKRIRSSDLEESLLLLPYTTVREIIRRLPAMLELYDSTELQCRVVLFLLRVHHAPLIADKNILNDVVALKNKTTDKINNLRDKVGCNVQALRWMQREAEEAAGERLFRDATAEKRSKDSRRRARAALKRPIVTVT